ncbi:polysaccharide biosynthesis/export family protein [Phenylobacterium sp.]|uniref:polysaccharide biosynthesis/export family protein n=1 Tax=Phenylobacterium sp. TaxID=1871053 RepID=UPI0035AE25B7
MSSRLARRFAASLGFIALLVCTSTAMAQSAAAPVAAIAPASQAQPVSSQSDTSNLPTYAGSEYRLGPGDKVRVIVFGEESLTGEFVVAGNGKVAFPLVGDVQAANLTIPQFQDNLVAALRNGYLKEPRVSAEVLTYRPYYILGEVNKPGEYPYSNGLTVLNAVATAGGFTYRAQTKRVFIRRLNETSETAYELRSETPVAPGDTIRIGERFF